MQKIYPICLFFALVSPFTQTKAQTFADTTFVVGIPYQNLDIITQISFPQFNPAWGQLQSADFHTHSLLTIRDEIENHKNVPSYVSVVFVDSVKIWGMLPNNAFLFSAMQGVSLDSFLLAASDGVMGSGNDFTEDTLLAADIQTDTTFTDSSLLASFTGIGTITDSVLATGGVDIIPIQVGSATIYSDMEISFSLHYHYLANAVSIVHLQAEMPLSVFPNPTKGTANLQFYAKTVQNLPIFVYNLNGSLVFSAEINAIQGKNEYLLATDTFAKGIYYVKIGAEVTKICLL